MNADLSLPQIARLRREPVTWVFGLGVVSGIIALSGLVPDGRLVFLSVAVSLILLTLALSVSAVLRQRARSARRRKTAQVCADDRAATLLVAPNGRIVAANPAASARFGDALSPEIGATLRGLVADPAALALRLQSRALREGSARQIIPGRAGAVELAVRALDDGDILWRIDSAVPTTDRMGESVAILDITRDGRILTMTPAARRLIGRRAGKLDGLFDELPLARGRIVRLNAARGPVDVAVAEVEQAHAHAEDRQLILSPIETPGITTEGSTLDALPVALLELTVDGRVIYANTAAQTLIGHDCRAEHLSDLVEGLGRSIPGWLHDAANRGGAPRSEVLRLSGRDAEAFLQVTVSRPLDGARDRLIAVLSDATELKTLEAQFVQSQKMQAIGQLAGGVAHDFNNLLTAISGYCDLLLLRHDTGDEDYGDLMQIHQNANRAAALVGQLLAFSRKQTMRAEVLDMRDTLADLTHLLNRLVGERVTLSLQHDPVLGAIRADRRQLEQVIMNLVVNARDAMPEGGEIRILTEALHLPEPMERDRATVPPGDYVTVKVIDQGVGIQPDKLQKVFEPFYTTKRVGEGTGLGLSTAYGIIKQTGGFIFVESAPGSGTCFTLILPVCQETAAHATVDVGPRRKPVPVLGNGVILLVEDEAPVRAFSSRALQMRGFTVIEAASAEEALAMLGDEGLHIDLFVTDVVMAGMDGPTWVREARLRRPHVGVVFVSGYAEGAFDGSLPEIGNSVFLPKPFSLAQLTETVRDQLAAAPAAT